MNISNKQQLAIFFTHLIKHLKNDSTELHAIHQISKFSDYSVDGFTYKINNTDMFHIYAYDDLNNSVINIFTRKSNMGVIASEYLPVHIFNYDLSHIHKFLTNSYTNRIKNKVEKYNKKQKSLENQLRLIS